MWRVLLMLAALWGWPVVRAAEDGEGPKLKPPKPKPGAEAAKDDAANQKINELLKAKKVSFAFEETPLADALAFVKALLDVNFVVAPEVNAKQRVTLKVNDMDAGAALQWMLKLAGARMEIENGGINVVPGVKPGGAKPGAPLERGEEEEAANNKIKEILKTKKVSFDFVETPVADALDFLRALINVNILVDPDVNKKQQVTLRVQDMAIGMALQWMCKLVGAKMDVRDGAIYVSSAAPAPGALLPGGRPQYVHPLNVARSNRMIGKAQLQIGKLGTVELYLYEDDVPQEARQALLKMIHKAMKKELADEGEGEGKK